MLMRKPNYSMERKDRDRAKQAKAAAKLEKRAAKGAGDRDEVVSSDVDHASTEGQAATAKESG
jgi:hypothetical protein